MLIVSTDRVCSIAYILQNPETRYNFDTLFAKKSNIFFYRYKLEKRRNPLHNIPTKYQIDSSSISSSVLIQ